MLMTSRTLGYAVLAAGFLAVASPAFAAGDGGNPSTTTGSTGSAATEVAPSSPSGSVSNPQRGKTTARRTAQNTATRTAPAVKAPSSMGEGTAGTPNSHPALAPSNAVQTNNPMGGH